MNKLAIISIVLLFAGIGLWRLERDTVQETATALSVRLARNRYVRQAVGVHVHKKEQWHPHVEPTAQGKAVVAGAAVNLAVTPQPIK